MVLVTISQAIREVMNELKRIATADEVVRKIEERYPKRWKERAIKTHLYGCSVNNEPAYTHHRSMPKFLFSLGKGRYELYSPEKHGQFHQGRLVGPQPERAAFPGAVEAISEEETVSFGLERDLEEYLSRNLGQLEDGLKLYSAEGLSGRQFNTEMGKIDLLALDRNGSFVVIELKAGVATERVVGQILSYMRVIRQSIAKGKEVRGIIVADDFDERLKYAVAELPNVKLKRYIAKFEFQEVVPQ